MTFIHEGNRTLAENLINFEKMVSAGGVRGGPSLLSSGEADLEHPHNITNTPPSSGDQNPLADGVGVTGWLLLKLQGGGKTVPGGSK